MASGSKKHVHKYFRFQLGFKKVWRCALPDCNHFMPAHLENLVEGRASICWKCGEETVILTPLNMEMEHPICISCMGFKPPEETFINEIGILSELIQSREKKS